MTLGTLGFMINTVRPLIIFCFFRAPAARLQ
jgi:hypothetical protein